MKSYLRFILLAGVCSVLSLPCYAQYDGSIPGASTVTPNAAALFKLSQRPQGSYTGTTPINIPLYSVTAGTLEVPVSLNYSNGGIRVEEIASWCGLGWNASAGGRVTRVMNGTPDDDGDHGGMLRSPLKPSAFPGGANWLINIGNILTGTQDMEPDIFYFDCNGLNGKFYFDESGNVRLVSQQNVKIEPQRISNVIKGWIITDDKGNKYYFGMDSGQTVGYVDESSLSYMSLGSYSVPSTSPSYISSWHLAEIKDMNDENSIRFSYTRNQTSFQTLSGAYMTISGMDGMDCTPGESYGDEVLVTNQTNEYYLTKIEGGNDSLLFHSSASRKDFAGGRRLDSIRLYARNNQLRKRHHFVYDYFSDPSAPSGFVNDWYYKRLKLNKVAEFGTAANDSLTHSFEYIETENLPSRFSRGTDYWGYFNGQIYNQTFMPNGTYYNGAYVYRRDNLADRRAEPYYSCANTLKKITYPTGGSRSFTYEGNKVLLEYGSQIKPDASYYTNQGFHEDNFHYSGDSYPSGSHDFTVNSTEGSANFSYYLTSGGWYGGTQVKILRMFAPGAGYEVMTFYDQMSGSWVLDNGNYRVEVYHNSSTMISAIDCNWQEQSISNNFVYRYNESYTNNPINAGGIRVKELNDYDPVSGKTNTTSYKYNLFSDTTITSGMLITPVRPAHASACQDFRSCQYIRLSSQSAYPLATEGGSYVVYPEVRTIEHGGGYTDKEYTFRFDTPPSASIDESPVVPPEDNSWRRGKVQLEKIYNNSGQLVKESYAEGKGWDGQPYDSGEYMLSSQIAYKVIGYYQSHTCNNTGGAGPCIACWRQYSLYSQFGGLKKTRESTYNGGGTAQDVVTEYDYYTELLRPVLKEKLEYLNNGSVKKTTYRYAFNNTGDFVFGLTTLEQVLKSGLLDKNYLQPLEISTTLTSQGGSPVLTEGAKFSFGVFNGTAYHPASIKQYSSATDYKETICSAYDTKGNLLEKYQPGGAREVYLWGYNGAYPVAKITGSNYSTVSSWITPSILNKPSSDAALQTHLNVIRTNLSGTPALVNTYTYKPLAGMSSARDAMGQQVFYEYDQFMRLKQVKDNDGNVLKSFQYHYQP